MQSLCQIALRSFGANRQHQQTITVHLPIYWGTTRQSFIPPTELEPSMYVCKLIIHLSGYFYKCVQEMEMVNGVALE